MKITPAWRKVLIGLGMVRLALGIIAIPLAPVLYEDHFVWLMLLRPTKEVFLAGGFFARQGDESFVLLYLAAIPISIFGAWLFYLLSRSYTKEIESGEVPGFAGKILKPERVKKFEKILDKRGPKLIFLGRLAVLSSAAVAAAAGAARMEPKQFYPWDLAGGLLAIAYTMAVGYFLGEAYEKAGPWITGLGFVAFIGFGYLIGRALKEE
jgi:membrane protein DedA with SNARE-associated domain